jgi:hypothetical protein
LAAFGIGVVEPCHNITRDVALNLEGKIILWTYLTVISPFMYSCEPNLVCHRKKRRETVFEKRVLRKVCGPKRDVVTG